MKSLHRPDMFSWSKFNEERNIDFNSFLWRRDDGNVLIDPLPLSVHDRLHIEGLGGVQWIVVTNSDHIRSTAEIASQFDAQIAGPAGEQSGFSIACDRWLADGDELVPGLVAIAFEGSKTPGELALLLEDQTLITGDLIRSHQGGRLMLLPDAKLTDRAAALVSLERLLEHRSIESVLVGDGWHIFRDGYNRLRELLK